MSKNRVSDLSSLAKKYVDGYATSDEDELLEKYYEIFDDGPEALSSITPEELDKIGARLSSMIDSEIVKREDKRRLFTSYRRIAVVAAAILAVFTFTLLIKDRPQDDSKIQRVSMVNDILPGKNGATLQFADGRKIVLNDGKEGVVIKGNDLEYSDGSGLGSDRDLVNAQPVIASTKPGQNYTFTLPDGTKVWLNASSRLTVHLEGYGNETRRVELEGEAYFEVAKLYSKHLYNGKIGQVRVPFLVQSKGQVVEVLGTHFNVNSYADEAVTKTTLVEGSVRVTSLRSTGASNVDGAILKPNQQSLVEGASLEILDVQPEEVVSWKDGKMRFTNARLDEVLRQLSRWYGVEIRYSGAVPQKVFTGGIEKNVNLSVALEILRTLKVNFRIEDKTIIVMDKK